MAIQQYSIYAQHLIEKKTSTSERFAFVNYNQEYLKTKQKSVFNFLREKAINEDYIKFIEDRQYTIIIRVFEDTGFVCGFLHQTSIRTGELSTLRFTELILLKRFLIFDVRYIDYPEINMRRLS